MKSVLMSIKPKYCELIASGKKTVEVRKTKPKLETPFKVYIYCTQGEALALPCLNNPHYTIHRVNNGTLSGRKMTAEERGRSDQQFANGKVIGEFVCDCIDDMPYVTSAVEGTMIPRYVGNNESCTCLREIEIFKYGRGNLLYAWHISDLKIYDKPRELSEFYVEGDCDCMNCKKCHWFDRGNGYNVEDDCALAYKGAELHKSFKPIIRPPQSWCYVERSNENDE